MLHYARQQQHGDPSLLEAVNAKEKASFMVNGVLMTQLHQGAPDWYLGFGMTDPAWRILVQAWNEGVCTMPCSCAHTLPN